MMENACIMHHDETTARHRRRFLHRLSPLTGILLMAVVAVLSGCPDTWNNPHTPESESKVTYYASYSNQPRHLDPVRAYSSEEGLFLEQIYEPPLQYHLDSTPKCDTPLRSLNPFSKDRFRLLKPEAFPRYQVQPSFYPAYKLIADRSHIDSFRNL